MIQIYHNPRCSKSREGVQILESSGFEFEIHDYMKNPLSKEELKDIVEKLKIAPIDLVRKKESIWIENYKGKDLTDEEIIHAMVENPRLIERPIVVNGSKAIVGRPPQLIKDIL